MRTSGGAHITAKCGVCSLSHRLPFEDTRWLSESVHSEARRRNVPITNHIRGNTQWPAVITVKTSPTTHTRTWSAITLGIVCCGFADTTVYTPHF
jgi:hypothetical protein